jgi:hypothetical protein
MASYGSSPRRAALAFAGLALLAGCGLGGEAGPQGTATLLNETGRDDLRVFVHDGDGRPLTDGSLDPGFKLDTQFVDRDEQCLTDGDGGFEIREPDGSVLVRHEFADRPVCDQEEIDVLPDGELVWP